MKTDIVMVSFGMAQDVIDCLAALGAWPYGTIWIVNNSAHEPGSSKDNALLEGVVKGRSDVVVLTADENLGFGRGCNLAFAHSRAEAVLLLNPDARIEVQGLLELMTFLEKSPRCGAVAPAMYWNDSQSFLIPPCVDQTPLASLSLALSTRWAWWASWQARRALGRMRSLSDPLSVSFVRFVSGAVLLVRRVAAQMAATRSGLDAGALFDPEYFMFFEDSDLSVRLRSAGWVLAVHSGIKATHHYRHKPYKGQLMLQSRQHYFRKRFPRFYRFSGALGWLDALMVSVDPGSRFELISQPLQSAADLAEKTNGAAVLALSPSLLAWPAIYRPFGLPLLLDEADWALLEPGQYVVLLEDMNGKRRWCCFERGP